ncbi:hypothetical protein FS837_008787 [Tulasnella sp. UAMH 9824]|nr:hypothetical protein FS837_008787 [Tulasnella sp. UAMH 9824]
MDTSQLIFHEKFNFHEGNIILSASGSLDGRSTFPVEAVYFRLHKSVLAVYSSTFADMLALPQADGAGSQAVVHLQDPLDHVIKLLTAIYYGGSVPQAPLCRTTWDFLVPVVMLTDKYDMGTLGASLLPKLLEDWPTTLEKWEDVDKKTHSIVLATSRQRARNPSLPTADDVLPDPAMAVNFGRAHPAARNVLPAAFYHLSRLSSSTRDDLQFGPYDPEAFRSADYSLMTSEDWRRLVRGQSSIREWLERLSSRWPGECNRLSFQEADEMEIQYCEGTPDPCNIDEWWNRNVRPSILRIGTKRVVDVLGQLDNIQIVVDKINRATTSEDEICYSCQRNIVKGLKDSRNKIWRQLPCFFGLGAYPNWRKS